MHKEIGPSSRWAGRSDVVLGMVLVAVGAVLFFYVIPTWTQPSPSNPRAVMSPRFLPNVVAVATAALGVAIGLWGAFGAASAGQRTAGSPLRGLAMVGAALAAYFLLIDILGALAVAVLVTVALQLAAGERRWRVVLAGGVMTPAIAVLLLTRLAHVPLPVGPAGI